MLTEALYAFAFSAIISYMKVHHISTDQKQSTASAQSIHF